MSQPGWSVQKAGDTGKTSRGRELGQELDFIEDQEELNV